MLALTRFVLAHKRLVVLLWAALAVAGAMTAGLVSSRMSTDFTMPGTAATVNREIVARYGGGGSQAPLVAVVTAPPGERVSDPANAPAAARALAAAQVTPAIRVVDAATTGDARFVTSDTRSTYALVLIPPRDFTSRNDVTPSVQAAVAAATPPGWHSGVTGLTMLMDAAAPKQSNGGGTGVLAEALIGGAGALVVLAVVFASFLAVLPLVMGAVSVLSTFLLVLGLTVAIDVSVIVEFLIGLIGLGVAIDYSLLVVSRWREERARGRDNVAAVEQAMLHAGRAVVFSGLTVAVGLLAMVVLPVPMLRSMGIGGVLVPLVSVLVALTLLPVILASAGPRLDWPRLRTERTASRMWSAWARLVYRRRWIAAASGTALLAVIAVPALSLQLGEPSSSALAVSGPARDTLDVLTRGGVPSGVLTPIEVLTSRGGATAATLAHVPGIDAAMASSSTPGMVVAIPTAETSLAAGQDTVRQVEAALSGDRSVSGVGGPGAALIDFNQAVYGAFPLMLGIIALATFLLLARAFRSLLLAFKAVVFNLVSLAAAYGVLVWVWQQGHGSEAIWGIPASGAITMWVPLMVFAFLFGLSMDYEVFILARIREAYDATGSARAAVVEGIGRTGRLVTSAALILMLTFLLMSSGPETDVKILATGLGAGILVDAVVVRALMVPAMVALLGRWNWWLPERAARLLRVAPSAAGMAARDGDAVAQAA